MSVDRGAPISAHAQRDRGTPRRVRRALDASALSLRYKLALKRAGLPPLRFHDLRHTFGTRVISNPGVSKLWLKAWMAAQTTVY